MTAQYTQCAIITRSGERCTAEALDDTPDALVHICSKHAARVMQLIRERADERAALVLTEPAS